LCVLRRAMSHTYSEVELFDIMSLPLDKAIEYAGQILEALDAANKP